jgi:hypothetical protein
VTSPTCLQFLHGNPQIIRQDGCTERLAVVRRATEALRQFHGLLAEELARSSEAVACRVCALDILVMMLTFLRIEGGKVMVRATSCAGRVA